MYRIPFERSGTGSKIPRKNLNIFSKWRYPASISITPVPRIERGCPGGPRVRAACDTIPSLQRSSGTEN